MLTGPLPTPVLCTIKGMHWLHGISTESEQECFHSTQGSWKLFFKTTMNFSWCTLHLVRGNLHATVLSTVIGTDLVCTLTNKKVLISAQFSFTLVQSAALAVKLYKPWKILQVGLYLPTPLSLGEMAESDREVSVLEKPEVVSVYILCIGKFRKG